MATFWERAAHTVSRMFSVCLFVILIISKLGYEDRILIPIVPVPGNCLHFYSTPLDLLF